MARQVWIGIALFIAAVAAPILYYLYFDIDIAKQPLPLFAALAAIIASTNIVVSAQRHIWEVRRSTLAMLIDARLSSEFRVLLEDRRLHFPAGDHIDPAVYKSHLNARRSEAVSDQEAGSRKRSATAVQSLLNYYEFIAVGIELGDLDEDVLKRTVRAIMCYLVRDCHAVLLDYRSRNPRAYEHLVGLYERWRDPDFPPIA